MQQNRNLSVNDLIVLLEAVRETLTSGRVQTGVQKIENILIILRSIKDRL